MSDYRLPLQVSRGCVQASFQSDPDEALLARFRQDLLRFVRDHSADSVVVDLSGVRILDRSDFQSLRSTLDMASLLGVRVVITGLRPGLVATLVELGLDLPYPAGLDLDHGFDIVRKLRENGA